MRRHQRRQKKIAFRIKLIGLPPAYYPFVNSQKCLTLLYIIVSNSKREMRKRFMRGGGERKGEEKALAISLCSVAVSFCCEKAILYVLFLLSNMTGKVNKFVGNRTIKENAFLFSILSPFCN